MAERAGIACKDNAPAVKREHKAEASALKLGGVLGRNGADKPLKVRIFGSLHGISAAVAPIELVCEEKYIICYLAARCYD